MQTQRQAGVDKDVEEVEKVEQVEYKFCCCRCTKEEISEIARTSDPSKDDVITRQPDSSSGNATSDPKYDSGQRNGFNGKKHEVQKGAEMAISTKRLQEESTNVTSAVLDSLINESREIDLEDESGREEQKITFKEMLKEVLQTKPEPQKAVIESPSASLASTLNQVGDASKKQTSNEGVENMESIMIDYVNENQQESAAIKMTTKSEQEEQSASESVSKSKAPVKPKTATESGKSARIEILPTVVTSATSTFAADVHSSNSEADDDRESQFVYADFDDNVDYDDTNEARQTSGASDTRNVSEQTAKSDSFVKNSEQVINMETERNKTGFLDDDGADDFEQVAENSSHLKDVLADFKERKLPPGKKSIFETQSVSMICIPDEDIVQDRKNGQEIYNSMGMGSDAVPNNQWIKNENSVRPSKMYASDISTSSSSDDDEEDVAESAISSTTGNTSIVQDKLEKKHTPISKPKDLESMKGGNALSEKQSTRHKSMQKNDNAAEIFTDDEFNERLI